MTLTGISLSDLIKHHSHKKQLRAKCTIEYHLLAIAFSTIPYITLNYVFQLLLFDSAILLLTAFIS